MASTSASFNIKNKESPLVNIYHFKEGTVRSDCSFLLNLIALTLYRLDPSTTQSGGAKATASEME